jgi:hypothetical protein
MPWVRRSAYETVETALADLDAIEQLPKDEMIGQYDAAVIDKEGGKPHVVKRTDRRASVSSLSGSEAGRCPARSSTRRLSSSPLTRRGSSRLASQPSKKGLDKAPTKAAKVVNRTVEATTDEITSNLQEALKR